MTTMVVVVIVIRAARIELLTAWAICRASYKLLENSTDTGSRY